MHILREEQGRLGKRPEERSLEEQLRYGVVCIDKPAGPSSHEVSAFVRRMLQLQRTGHTGTLDQNVSGVLVVLLNEARKLSGYFARSPKSYVCLMRLQQAASQEELKEAFAHFRGTIYQTPPEASAVKKRLRTRTVYALNVLEIEGKNVLFACECEAGTYLRNLVRDVGEVLGVASEMRELRRTYASGLSEDQAVTLQQLSDYYWLWKKKGREEHLRKTIVPVEEPASKLMKKIVVSDDALKKTSSGVPPKISDVLQMEEGIEAGEAIACFTAKGELAFVLQPQLSTQQALEWWNENKDAEFARVLRVVQAF